MLVAQSPAIGPIDLTIVAIYVAVTTLLGVLLGRSQADNRDYFLGGRRLPTWTLLISIVATETSTVTFLSVPGLSYVDGGDFTFLQIAFGYVLGRLAIVAWLLPHYFRGEMLTAYQVLERRFGVTTRRVASLVFLATRNLSDGLRLFLTALALNIAVGFDMVTSILVTAIATVIYTFFGGVRSVVWNDCIQFGVYMLGAIAASWLLLSRLPGGWEQLVDFGTSTGRFRLLDFDPSLTKANVTFWSGLVGGAFLTLSTHGADHLIVQRYLCAKDQRSAGWALGLSGLIVLAQFALFLLIGVQIANFHAVHGAPTANLEGDAAFMTFVVNHMGVGMKGLILAAVLAAAMSTLSSSLNSSASSLTNDWLSRYLATMDDRRSLALSRVLTLVFGVVQTGVAMAAYFIVRDMTIVAAVLKIAGFASGLLLGLYALGLFAPRTSEQSALVAFMVGTLVTCGVAFATPLSGWWYALVGSTTIFGVGILLGLVLDPPRPEAAAA